MLRSAISRAVGKNRSMPPHMEAGVPRTIATIVVLPTVAVAAGIHYSPEFRSLVDQNVPGAVDALSKATGTDYSDAAGAAGATEKTGSTLPPNYETLPDLLKRIGDDEKGGESKAGGAKGAESSPSNISGDTKTQGLGSASTDEAKTGKSSRKSGVSAGENGMKDAGSLFSKAKNAASNGAAEASANATSLAEKAAGAAKSAENALSGLGSRASEFSKKDAGTTGASGSPEASATEGSKRPSGPSSVGSSDAGHGKGEKTAKSSEAPKSVPGNLGHLAGEASDKASSLGAPNTDFVKDAVGAATKGAQEAGKVAGEAAKTSFSPSSAPGSIAPKGSSIEQAGDDKSKSWWKFGFGSDSGAQEPSRLNTANENGNKAVSASGTVSDAPKTKDSGGKGADDKFARLFGKGQFDPSAVKGKDVVDVSVYERPKYLRSEADATRAVGGSPGKALSGSGSKSMTEAEALKAELKSQAKWDAVRLQEAVRAQSVAEKKAAAAELAAVTKKHKLALNKAKEQAMAEAQAMIDAKLREMELQMEKRRDAEVAKLLKVRESSLKLKLESELLDRERAAAGERQREIMSLKASVDALHDDLDQSREHRKASQTASAVAASAFALKDALQGSGSFATELKTASRTSELGALIASSIPEEVSKDGLPTVEELRDAFGSVSREGRKAALVPEGEVNSMWAHFLANIVSRIKIAVDTRAEPQGQMTNEERIRLAEKRVACGDLKGAVQGLDGLKGLSAEIMTDWIALANARIAADVGAQALLADAIITQQSLATMTKSSEKS